jgi:predicted AAA+ superfamily ATPase
MWLNQIFLTTKINYYDIKGKKILQTKFKYYATDLGILSINTSFNVMDNYGYRLENLILLKFLEEGWKVYTGNDRYGNEIDFIIEKNFIKKYIQVCDELNENNYLRESRSLLSVNDGYEKIILCMKNNKAREDDGIKIINIVEWILK